MEKFTFRFSVLGRYRTQLEDNETHVTVNMAAGRPGRLTYSGTLTMSESEWEAFISALTVDLPWNVEVEDVRPSSPSNQIACTRQPPRAATGVRVRLRDPERACHLKPPHASREGPRFRPGRCPP